MPDRLFRDRRDAGRFLAGLLERYRDRPDVIVLGLPRGGVPVAYEVAAALGAPLGVFLVRKLGVPGRELLAMGAIASGMGAGHTDMVCAASGVGEGAYMQAVHVRGREASHPGGCNDARITARPAGLLSAWQSTLKGV